MSNIEKIIKLFLATIIAYILADFLKLSYASSSGVIAILSVLDTRRTTLKIACERFLSAILAFFLAYISFAILGYWLFSFSIFLLIYLTLSFLGKLSIGIAPSIVLVFHCYNEKSMSVSLLLNEFSLFFIGVGVALVINMYMRDYSKDIELYHLKVEKLLKEVLLRFAYLLKKGDGTNKASLIIQLDKILNEALELVYKDSKNHFIHQTNYHVHYFEMRRQQNELLSEMAVAMNSFQFDGSVKDTLADLLIETSHQLSQENPASDLLEKIHQTLDFYRDSDLPKTRGEFESRAVLYHLLKDLERFITLKVEFYKHYHLEEK